MINDSNTPDHSSQNDPSDAIAPLDDFLADPEMDAHLAEQGESGPGEGDDELFAAELNAQRAGQADRRAAVPKNTDGSLVERRKVSGDRRDDEPAPTGLERRRGPGRRLSDHLRAAEEGEMTKEQFLFLKAIDAFKQANRVNYPAWTDVLEVIRLLGYRKVQSSALNLPAAEDWSEPPTAPAAVRPDGFERRLRDAA